ncbi:hypothetical protein NL676_012685 [Syzygium grande]|nr:hypothetical protein NL676_012685 [Syzygium grande]
MFCLQEKLELVEGKVDWKGRTALKHEHGGMRIGLLILATFGFEQMATVALAVNLVIYFSGVLHFEFADAANQLTNFMGSSYILSIAVAALADVYIGRFNATLISGCVEFLGLALLTVQAHYPGLRPPKCNIFDSTSRCEKVGGGNAALFFIALYLLAAGSAGIKAALPAHGADQFDEKDPREARDMSSFFNFLLLIVCLGSAASLTLIVWIQDNKGWDWGFGLSTIAMFLGVVLFTLGLPMHRIQPIQGTSTIIEIVQVFVAAIRNRKLQLPEDPTELYEFDRDAEAAGDKEFLPYRDTFRFLDKAAIKETPVLRHRQSESPNPWKLPSPSNRAERWIQASQARSRSRPPSLAIIPVSFLIIIVPIYDRVIVPFVRKFTGHPTGITHLQRIGVGLLLSSISMAVAAIMEVKRKKVARDHGMLDAIPVTQPLPISVFWLSFQFFIFGIADMFTYVGLLELFYSEAPKGLKSLSTCFLWCSMALGYFFSSILVKIVNRATEGVTRSGGWLAGNNINRNHLNLFYLLLSIMSITNFFAYLVAARRYKYRPRIAPAVSK